MQDRLKLSLKQDTYQSSYVVKLRIQPQIKFKLGLIYKFNILSLNLTKFMSEDTRGVPIIKYETPVVIHESNKIESEERCHWILTSSIKIINILSAYNYINILSSTLKFPSDVLQCFTVKRIHRIRLVQNTNFRQILPQLYKRKRLGPFIIQKNK